MTQLAELKQRLMENPEVRKEYAKLDAEFALIEAMITAPRGGLRDFPAERRELVNTTQRPLG